MTFTPKQLSDLKRSGITPEEATAAGVRGVVDPAEAGQLLGWDGLGPVPALAFMYHHLADSSQPTLYARLKPDEPLAAADGKAMKYLQPRGKLTDIYCPMNVERRRLLDVGLPIHLTEGEKKCIKLNMAGFLGLGAPGVWNFHQKQAFGNSKRLKASLATLPLQGRKVVIIFDAMKFEKLGVLGAELALAEMLHAAGARPMLAHLLDDPRVSHGPDDTGADDYLAVYGAAALAKNVIAKSYHYPLTINLHGERGQRPFELIGATADDLRARFLPYLAVMPETQVLQSEEMKRFVVDILKIKTRVLERFIKTQRLILAQAREVTEERACGEQGTRRRIDISAARTFDERCQDTVAVLDELKAGYRIGSIPVFIVPGRPPVPLADSSAFNGFLAEHVEFYTVSKLGGKSYGLWPQNQVEAFLNRPSCIQRFRELRAMVDLPVYDDNFNLLRSGYDDASQIYVTGETIDPSNLVFHIERLIGELCYAQDGSKTNRLGALLAGLMPTQFMGDKPLVLWQANQRGLGKSWSAEADGIVKTGGLPRTISYTPDDSELEKQLAAAVLEGAFEILIDNAKVPLRSSEISSGVLERSITNPELNFRILGKSKFVTRPNSVQFGLTANCPRLSPDLVSRSMPINLYYEGDPARRRFSITDPRQYAQTYRREIWAELIGMVERWKRARMPRANIDFRFGRFAAIVGGILQESGYIGFLSNVARAEELFSSDYADLVELLSVRPELRGPPKAFADAAQELELFKGELQGKKGPGAYRKVAEILSRYVGRELRLNSGEVVTLEAKENTNAHTKTYARMRVSEVPSSPPSSQDNSKEPKTKSTKCEDAKIELQEGDSEKSKDLDSPKNRILREQAGGENIFASSQTAAKGQGTSPSGREDHADGGAPSSSQSRANQEGWTDEI